jgi:hypothetical protein
MAASGFKWLLLPLAGLLLVSGKKQESPHPVHLSVIEINHNAVDKTLEISCKIFTDDFEKILAKNYKSKVDLTNPPNQAAMDSLVKKYIFSHFSIKADGRPAAIQYVGFENESDAVYSYMEVNNVPAVKKIDVSSNLMYDMFEDEIIIIHTIVGGNRKSNKLDYPATNISFSF